MFRVESLEGGCLTVWLFSDLPRIDEHAFVILEYTILIEKNEIQFENLS